MNELEDLPDISDQNSKEPSFSQDLAFNEMNKILCNHCLRSRANGKKCLGRCIADSEY